MTRIILDQAEANFTFAQALRDVGITADGDLDKTVGPNLRRRTVDARKRDEELLRAWDESQHPRVPAGGPDGGQFGEGGGVSSETGDGDDHKELREGSKAFLNEAERKILKSYQSAGYSAVNHILRGDDLADLYAGQRSTVDKMVAVLDGLFLRASLAHDTVVYRVVSDDVYKKIQDHAGGRFVDKAFVSASDDKKWIDGKLKSESGLLFIKIVLPRGAKAIPVADLSNIPEEREFLIARNSGFSVIKSGNGLSLRLL